MYAIMNTKIDSFSWVDWMVGEREKLGMTQADLAHEAKLTRTTISDYEKRQRPNPDIRALVKISVALKHNPLRLPREAGLIPPEHDIDKDIEQILSEIEKLSKQDQDEVLAFIRMKQNLRKKK